MVSRRIARALLDVAARRWPADLRAELHQEWSAELHVLAAERRHARMLRYAASLAVARPAPRRSVPIGTVLAGAWRVARLVLVAPLLCVALLAASLLAMNVAVNLVKTVTGTMELPLATLFVLAAAVMMARIGRRWTLDGAPPGLLLLAVTAPGFAFALLMNSVLGGVYKLAVHAPAYAVFFLGLGAVLAAVGRLARAGRRGAAWATGALGAVLAADLAVVLTVLNGHASTEELPPAASAPVWLFTAVTDSGFGVPGLGGTEIFLVGDVVELDPWLYLIFTALALGAVIGRAGRAVGAAPTAGPVAGRSAA
ncbi:hypothetical protein [Micromonospora zhanjiangensis]|uniref:Uncharacterized protein n=1 Tax=Micromonospora zhanjiangensis TaxID=1522057 RepID=A0ABV8KHT2_9ACTN